MQTSWWNLVIKIKQLFGNLGTLEHGVCSTAFYQVSFFTFKQPHSFNEIVCCTKFSHEIKCRYLILIIFCHREKSIALKTFRVLPL